MLLLCDSDCSLDSSPGAVENWLVEKAMIMCSTTPAVNMQAKGIAYFMIVRRRTGLRPKVKIVGAKLSEIDEATASDRSVVFSNFK